MVDHSVGPSVGQTDLPGGHVLHVVDSAVFARFVPMFFQVVGGLDATGFRVSLVTNDGEMIERLAGLPVECHWTPHIAGWRAWGLRTLLNTRFKRPPDLVHLWGGAGIGWVDWWTREQRVPMLVHALGQQDVQRLQRRRLRQTDHIAVAAETLARQMLDRLPAAAGRIRTLTPAVAPPLQVQSVDVRDRLPAVLCVAPFEEGSGHEHLIDAAVQLRQKGMDLQVGLVGSGSAVDAVWRHVRAQRVGECVSVVDVPRLWEKVLPEVDIVVVPSCQTELHVVPLLAMALGKVVIASRDQLADWFVEDETTWQFTPGSAVELAYLLTRVIEQPRHVAALTESAAAYVRTHHAVHEMIARMLQLYDTIAGRMPQMPAETSVAGDHGRSR